jgi:hypothetical protein
LFVLFVIVSGATGYSVECQQLHWLLSPIICIVSIAPRSIACRLEDEKEVVASIVED